MSKARIPYRHRDATQIALAAAASAGPIGAFSSVADIASIATIWGTCLYSVAAEENCSLDADTAVGICKSALLGLSGYYVGCKTATKAFLMIPGAGVIVAMGASAVTNVLFTYRFVLTLTRIFQEIDGLDIECLADNIRTMFKGNGLLDDAREIAAILIG